MSLANIIRNMQIHLNNAYDALEEKGATIPEAKNLNNLATTVQSVITGGGEEETPPSSGDGFNINGIIEEYYVYAGDSISAGDFVNFIEGVASKIVAVGTPIDTSEAIINNITSNYAYGCQALLLEDQKRILLVHRYSSSTRVVLLTVANGVVTVLSGTDTTLFNGTSSYTAMKEIDTNKILIVGNNGSYTARAALVIVNEDNTLTLGGAVNITSNCYERGYAIQKIDTNHAFILHGGKSGSSNAQALIATIDGTTLTLGEKADIENVYSNCVSTIKINNNQILAIFGKENHVACYCNINGNTVTISNITTINEKPESWVTRAISLDATTVLHIYDDESTDYQLLGQFLYLNTDAIVASETFMVDETLGSGNALDMIQLSNGKIIIANGIYDFDDNIYTSLLICEYANSALNVINKYTYASTKYGETTGQNLDLYLFDNDDIGLLYSDNDDSLLATHIHSLDEATNNLVPIAHTSDIVINYETQVQKSTNNVFNGIAKTSGVGGDDMGHNEKIEIYTL